MTDEDMFQHLDRLVNKYGVNILGIIPKDLTTRKDVLEFIEQAGKEEKMKKILLGKK